MIIGKSLRRVILIFSLSLVLVGELKSEEFKKWCGKNYENGSPDQDPGGKFSISPKDEGKKILCTPTLKPFLESDRLEVIVDVPILKDKTSRELKIINLETGEELLVSNLSSERSIVGPLRIGRTSLKPYSLECRSFGLISHRLEVSFLPKVISGSAVQLDARTGFFNVLDKEGSLKTFFPYGFYTGYGGYLNGPDLLAIVKSMKDRRINLVHIVPDAPYIKDIENLRKVLKALADSNIYLQYDMRHSYNNQTLVELQVNEIKNQPNLLTWYTADEPDGAVDDFNVPKMASSLINSIDPYHPVALVLNCEDYYFSEYTSGTDVIMTDPYPISMKSSTFSSRWNTSCTPTHGDCGCDNCKGNFKDISSRMEKFKVRRDLLMRSRSMQIWGVPQAFKDESYWERPPTGVEFLLSCSLYVLEGAVGLVGWIENSDMSEELKQATKVFGIALEKMIGYLTLPDNYLIHQSVNSHNRNIMVRYWKDSSNSSILLISTNMVENSQAWSIDLSSEFLDDVDSKRSVSFRIEVVEKIFESNVLQSLEIKKGDTLIGSGNFDGLGCGAYILKFSN